MFKFQVVLCHNVFLLSYYCAIRIQIKVYMIDQLGSILHLLSLCFPQVSVFTFGQNINRQRWGKVILRGWQDGSDGAYRPALTGRGRTGKFHGKRCQCLGPVVWSDERSPGDSDPVPGSLERDGPFTSPLGLYLCSASLPRTMCERGWLIDSCNVEVLWLKRLLKK